MWQNDISSIRKKYYRKYGREHRERTPKEVHERIQNLLIKNAEIAKRNVKWFDSAPEEFMAEYTPKAKEVQDIYYVVYFINHADGSHCTKYIRPNDRDDLWARCLRDEELPLYTYRGPCPKDVSDTIKQRLKGELKEIPIIQHLHEEKQIIDRKWSRIRNMITRYLNFFMKIAEESMYKVPRKYDSARVYIITVEGTEYPFLKEANRLVHLYPEDLRRINL